MILFSFSTILTACVSQTPHQNNNVKPKEIALSPKEVNHFPANFLADLMDLARKGRVKDCPFNALDSTMGQVKSVWGEPDKVDKAGFGFYATYTERNVVLGYNKDGEIFDVRSYKDDLKEISDQMVVKAFGQPAEVSDNSNETINVYSVNQTYN